MRVMWGIKVLILVLGISSFSVLAATTSWFQLVNNTNYDLSLHDTDQLCMAYKHPGGLHGDILAAHATREVVELKAEWTGHWWDQHCDGSASFLHFSAVSTQNPKDFIHCWISLQDGDSHAKCDEPMQSSRFTVSNNTPTARHVTEGDPIIITIGEKGSN